MKRVLSLSELDPSSSRPRFDPFVARSLEGLTARGDWGVMVVNPLPVPPVLFGRFRGQTRGATDGLEPGVKSIDPSSASCPASAGAGTRC